MCGPWSGATNPTQGNPRILVQEQRPTVLPGRHEVLRAKLFLWAEVGSTCVAGIFFFSPLTHELHFFLSLFRK